MVFHKTAIDVIAKGLDLKFPHSKLGPDGMLLESSGSLKKELEEFKATSVVIDLSLDVVKEQDNVVTNESEKKDEDTHLLQETTDMVVAKTVRRPPGRTSKISKDPSKP